MSQPPTPILLPAFQDLHKPARELLNGARGEGVFQFAHKFSATSTTADGITFTVSAARTAPGQPLESTLSAAYLDKRYIVDGLLTSSGLTSLGATFTNPGGVAGLQVSATTEGVDLARARLTADYTRDALHLRGGLTGLSKAPLVDLSVTTGFGPTIVGGNVALDATAGKIGKWDVGVGYAQSNYQIAAVLADQAANLNLSYVHRINLSTSVGAELTQPVNLSAPAQSAAPTNFNIGLARRLDNGALTKFRVDNLGLVAGLYQQQVTRDGKLTLSAAVDAKDLNRSPKIGVAFDLTPTA